MHPQSPVAEVTRCNVAVVSSGVASVSTWWNRPRCCCFQARWHLIPTTQSNCDASCFKRQVQSSTFIRTYLTVRCRGRQVTLTSLRAIWVTASGRLMKRIVLDPSWICLHGSWIST